MIHHETFSAKNASESGGSGHFDIIEIDGEFQVIDGHMGRAVGFFDTMERAIEECEGLVHDYEAQG